MSCLFISTESLDTSSYKQHSYRLSKYHPTPISSSFISRIYPAVGSCKYCYIQQDRGLHHSTFRKSFFASAGNRSCACLLLRWTTTSNSSVSLPSILPVQSTSSFQIFTLIINTRLPRAAAIWQWCRFLCDDLLKSNRICEFIYTSSLEAGLMWTLPGTQAGWDPRFCQNTRQMWHWQ